MSDLYREIGPAAAFLDSTIPPKPGRRDRQQLSILMVEDNVVSMMLLRAVLKKMLPKAELIEAGNGLVAVNICEQKLPHIVFVDVQMPVMNGLEATRAIRAVLMPGICPSSR